MIALSLNVALFSIPPRKPERSAVTASLDLTSLHALLERKSRWTVGLHLDNLFNGPEPISGQALDSNLVRTVTAAPPRTIRITLTTDF